VRRPATGAGEGRGAARCVAYEARGYMQAGQTDLRKTCKPTARIEPKSRVSLACNINDS